MVLASASPRRAELLHTAGIDFRQCAVPHEEAIEELYDAFTHNGLHLPQLEAAKLAIKQVAEDKYQAAREALNTDELILTADTIVFHEGTILEKPIDTDDARRMLQLLAGDEHQVLSAVCLGRGEDYESFVVVSDVRFHPYDHDVLQIERYLASERALEYAGAYGMQDPDFPLLAAVEGSSSNVIGLPMEETLERLRHLI